MNDQKNSNNNDNKPQNSILERINTSTRLFFSSLWTNNARINHHNKSDFRKIQNLEFDGKVALICGTSPSLTEHIPLIKQYRDKFEIWCADTAFPILYDNEIYPDFVVSIDPSPELASCFAFKDFSKCPKTLYIAPTVAAPAVLSCWRSNKVYLYNLYDPNVPEYLEAKNLFPNFGAVASKFNVGEFMVFVAVKFCAYPNIILTGMDFCFFNNKLYADGVNEKINEMNLKVFNDNNSFVSLSNEGLPVVTNNMLFVFAKTFNMNYKMLYEKQAKFYNLTKGLICLPYQLAETEAFLKEVK